MNRSFKFRAWNGKYLLYDDFYVDSDGDVRILTDSGNYGGYNYLSLCSDWKLSQFTGVFDKNGKEIYEGDICLVVDRMYDEPYKSVIKYSNEFCCFYHNTENFDLSDFINTMNYSTQEIEVLGNIYENPNLLTNE